MAKSSCFKRIVFISLLVVLMASSITLCGLIVNNASAISGTWNDKGNYSSAFKKEVRDGVEYRLIKSEKDLARLNYYFGSFFAENFILCADLDMSAHYWVPGGTFKGTFDGNGHTISGITMQEPASGSNSSFEYAGLFRQTEGATITNLQLKDFKIYGLYCSGAVAGFMAGGTVSNVTVSLSTIIARNSRTITPENNIHSGGIVGAVHGGTIFNCGSEGCEVSSQNNKIYAKTSKKDGLVLVAGGIVGYAYGASITQCYSRQIFDEDSDSSFGRVHPYHGNYVYALYVFLGGIAGEIDGSCTFEKCYNTFRIGFNDIVNSNYIDLNYAYVGGVVGYSNGCPITACYNTGSVKSYATTTSRTNKSLSSGKSFTYKNGHPTDGTDEVIGGNNYYSYSKPNVYAGGIVGYSESSVEQCYNTGSIVKLTGCDHYCYYELRFKIKGIWYTDSLTTHYVVSYYTNYYSVIYKLSGQNVTAHSICGNNNSNVSNCFTNSKLYSDSDRITSTIELYCFGDNNSLYDSSYSYSYDSKYKVTLNNYKYAERSSVSYYYYSDFEIDLSNYKVSFIYKDHYSSYPNVVDKNGTVFSLENIKEFYYDDVKSAGLSVGDDNLSSAYYAVDPKINNGRPHLKCFYWQDSASIN